MSNLAIYQNFMTIPIFLTLAVLVSIVGMKKFVFLQYLDEENLDYLFLGPPILLVDIGGLILTSSIDF